MSNEYELVEGKQGVIEVPITYQSDGSVVDLTGATVTLRWVDNDSAKTLIEKTMDLGVDPTLGVASYTFALGEVYAPHMRFDVDVTDSGGLQLASNSLIKVNVRKRLA